MKTNKVTFKNTHGKNLVGDFYPADSDVCVIFSHGFTGDRHEWGKFDEFARAIQKEGLSSLIFDFSGSGESDDETITIAKEVEDLNCAIQFAKKKGAKNIFLIGLSLGGLVSLKAFDENVKKIVLYAPVTQPNPDYLDLKYDDKEKKELKEMGYITINLKEGLRKRLKIDKQIIKERKEVNTEKIMKKITIPVLILHGDADTVIPIECSRKSLPLLPKGSKLITIKGDDHFDSDHYKKYLQPTLDWLKN